MFKIFRNPKYVNLEEIIGNCDEIFSEKAFEIVPMKKNGFFIWII